MIRVLWVLGLLLAAVAPARAEAPPRPVEELLGVLEGSGTAAQRQAAADELARHGADAIPVLEQFLRRKHKVPFPQRSDVLEGIGASVPDSKGNFKTPKRKSEEDKAESKKGELDWLAELLERSTESDAVREVVADVATLRALAAIKDPAAGDVIMKTGFRETTQVYRDECGRLLRKMIPYSLPALIRNAASERQYDDARRYATYQLERLDLEHPNKAMRAFADDERITAMLLRAYGQYGYRPAVDTVLAATNHDSPVVRAAARDAWMAYVTGPEPPSAPKKQLQLTGGRLSPKAQPLWLNYREMATVALNRLYPEVMGKDRDEDHSLENSSKEIFALWDDQRSAALGKRVDVALARAAADPKTAAAELDAVLALQPEHPRRAEMAPVYHELGKQLAQAQDWKGAAGAYAKAHALDPAGAHAEDALASHFYALAHAREAEGKDGTPFMVKAREIQPTPSEETRAIAAGGGAAKRSNWMLYAGIGGGLGALLLLALGLVARRNHH